MTIYRWMWLLFISDALLLLWELPILRPVFIPSAIIGSAGAMSETISETMN